MNNKDEQKKKAKLIIAFTFIFLLIVIVIMIFTYKDEIEQHLKEAKAENVGWDDSSENLGEIDENADWQSSPSEPTGNEDAESTETTKQDEIVTEVDGLGYKQYDCPSFGLSTFLPADWTITSNLHTIIAYDEDENSNTYNCQVSIMRLGVYETDDKASLERLRNMYTPTIEKRLQYHSSGQLYRVFQTNMGQKTELDNCLYVAMTATMINDSDKKEKPDTGYYYFYVGNNAYVMILQSPSTATAHLDQVGNTILENMKEFNEKKSTLVKPLDKDANTDYYTYKISSYFVEAMVNTQYISHYKVTDDITNPAYGIDIIVKEENAEGNESIDSPYYDEVMKKVWSEYLIRDYYSLSSNGYSDVSTYMTVRDTLLYKSDMTTAINVNGILSRTKTTYQDSEKEVLKGFQNGEMPVKSYTFMTSAPSEVSKRRLFVTVTYQDHNQDIAEQYITNIISTIKYTGK